MIIEEEKMVDFMDNMVKRCESIDEAYDKLSNYVKYLNYCEALEERSEKFRMLFDKRILNPIIEGNVSSFKRVYDLLKNNKRLNIKNNDNYSKKSILTAGRKAGYIVDDQTSEINDIQGINTSILVACGSSSSDRCGSSSSSSCGRSTPSYDRCGSSSSSSRCGYSSSRC